MSKSIDNKQTVEEAAKDFAGKEFTHEDGPFSTYEPLKVGFNAGAAWQKEQQSQAYKQMLEALEECITVKDLWSAEYFDTISADPDTSKLALLKMQQKIEAALSAALD
jgi:hypothetical protein